MAISKDNHRVSARVPDHVYHTLMQAADLMGATINQFLVQSALEKAQMMINAMKRLLKVSKHLGIIGFFVDGKDKGDQLIYEQFGFIPLPDNPLALFLPLATLQNVYERDKP